jgi:hypothetical protein
VRCALPVERGNGRSGVQQQPDLTIIDVCNQAPISLHAIEFQSLVPVYFQDAAQDRVRSVNTPRGVRRLREGSCLFGPRAELKQEKRRHRTWTEPSSSAEQPVCSGAAFLSRCPAAFQRLAGPGALSNLWIRAGMYSLYD